MRLVQVVPPDQFIDKVDFLDGPTFGLTSGQPTRLAPRSRRQAASESAASTCLCYAVQARLRAAAPAPPGQSQPPRYRQPSPASTGAGEPPSSSSGISPCLLAIINMTSRICRSSSMLYKGGSNGGGGSCRGRARAASSCFRRRTGTARQFRRAAHRRSIPSTTARLRMIRSRRCGCEGTMPKPQLPMIAVVTPSEGEGDRVGSQVTCAS